MGKPQRHAEILRITDQSKKAFTTPSITITVPAGAIGAVVNFQFPVFPILNNAGSFIGGDGDTSISISGAIFTNEVAAGTVDADFEDGDFYVDYLTGEGRGKKANSGTTLNWTWKYFSSSDESADGVTKTNVNDSASSIQLSAANTSRKGWSVFNDSSSILYINFGSTASLTAYVVQVAAGGFYEMPKPTYLGVINGIWSADSSGAARVTELT